MDTRSQKILLEFLPGKGFSIIAGWLDQYPVALTITRRRNTKMGDYRPPSATGRHRISVNGDLQPYAFLVTLVHELAHLVTWERYKRRVSPHGEQWKEQFRAMLMKLLEENAFEEEIKEVVGDFASGRISYRMFNLRFEKLIHHLTPSNGETLLGDLPAEAVFSLHNGRRFIKKERVRTRFRCQDMRNGRIYLISPLAKVHPLI